MQFLQALQSRGPSLDAAKPARSSLGAIYMVQPGAGAGGVVVSCRRPLATLGKHPPKAAASCAFERRLAQAA